MNHHSHSNPSEPLTVFVVVDSDGEPMLAAEDPMVAAVLAWAIDGTVVPTHGVLVDGDTVRLDYEHVCDECQAADRREYERAFAEYSFEHRN